jgi:multicomponent Na+:H+ antiporter subunit G
MSAALELASGVLLGLGAFFSIVGAVGILRMPDLFTRMHAAGLIDSLGAPLIILGLLLHVGLELASVKLLILGLLIFFSSPTATHALAKAALERGLKPVLAPGSEPCSTP